MGIREAWRSLRHAPEAVGDDLTVGAFFGRRSAIGSRVNSDAAIYSTAVAACVAVRAKTFSTLPIHVFLDNGTTRTKDITNPIYRLLKDAPNPHMTSARFWRWASTVRDLTGNTYFRIERGRGAPSAIHPLIGTVKPVITYDGGYPKVVGYQHRAIDGREYDLLPAEVIHWPSEFIAADGISGRSLVEIAREAIGLDVAADEFFGRVLTNGTHMGVVLTTDEQLNKNDVDQLTEMLADGAGIFPAGRTRVFQRGLKPVAVGMTIKDADLTEQRRYALERICGIWGIPLAAVQDLTHGTYSNTEQGDLALAKHGIRPVCVDAEQVLNLNLFADGQRFVKFDLNGLMRGDFATRMAGMATAVNAGIFTPNMALAFEDIEPLNGGDVLRFPLNTIDASMAVEYAESLLKTPEPPQPQPPNAVGDDGMSADEDNVVERALAPVRQDKIAAIKDRIDRGRSVEDTRVFADRILTPLIESYALAGITTDVDTIFKEALA